MSDYNNKIKSELISRIDNINDISILELGVQKGISTNYFLEICDKNNGKLYSVDIENCSEVSISPRWKFIHSRDDDFNKIFKLIPNLVDVIYIDSLHEAHHVEKLIYNYYTKLKDGGYIFIDDISHLPYLKNNPILLKDVECTGCYNLLERVYTYDSQNYPTKFEEIHVGAPAIIYDIEY